MQYHVRTVYGVSASAFSNTIDWLLGILQGSGHSCPSWGLTNSMMLDQMEQTPGAMFHSPHPEKQCKHIGEAFVDATSLWLLRLGMLLVAAIQLMAMTAQCWECLIYTTGGSLNVAKCFWNGISWQFTPTGEPTMVHTTDDGPPIQLTSGSSISDPQTIQRLPICPLMAVIHMNTNTNYSRLPK